MVSDAGYATQQVVLLSPYRPLAEGLAQTLVQVVQLLLEPSDVDLDTGPDGYSGTGEAVEAAVKIWRDNYGPNREISRC